MEKPSVHTWFLAGILMAASAVAVPAIIGMALQPSGMNGVDLLFGSTCCFVVLVVLIRLLGDAIGHRFSRPQRPHTLFTPLYDQR